MPERWESCLLSQLFSKAAGAGGGRQLVAGRVSWVLDLLPSASTAGRAETRNVPGHRVKPGLASRLGTSPAQGITHTRAGEAVRSPSCAASPSRALPAASAAAAAPNSLQHGDPRGTRGTPRASRVWEPPRGLAELTWVSAGTMWAVAETQGQLGDTSRTTQGQLRDKSGLCIWFCPLGPFISAPQWGCSPWPGLPAPHGSALLGDTSDSPEEPPRAVPPNVGNFCPCSRLCWCPLSQGSLPGLPSPSSSLPPSPPFRRSLSPPDLHNFPFSVSPFLFFPLHMVRPPLCLAQEPSLTSSAKPSLSGAAHERCSVKTEAGKEPSPSPP